MIKLNENNVPRHGEIIIYTTDDKEAQLDVKLADDTVWLTQKQIAELFKTERSVITKHINNVFNSKELNEISVCAIFAHTAADGRIYKTKFYNLLKSAGETKINDNTLVAVALLIAESKPKEKEIMTALITNLLNEY